MKGIFLVNRKGPQIISSFLPSYLHHNSYSLAPHFLNHLVFNCLTTQEKERKQKKKKKMKRHKGGKKRKNTITNNNKKKGKGKEKRRKITQSPRSFPRSGEEIYITCKKVNKKGRENASHHSPLESSKGKGQK